MSHKIDDEVNCHVHAENAGWVEHRVLCGVFPGCIQNTLQSTPPRQWARFCNHTVVNRRGTKKNMKLSETYMSFFE